MAPDAIQLGAREPDAEDTSATTHDRDGRPYTSAKVSAVILGP